MYDGEHHLLDPLINANCKLLQSLYQLIRLESSNIFYKKQVFLATFEILIDLCYKIDLIDDML